MFLKARRFVSRGRVTHNRSARAKEKGVSLSLRTRRREKITHEHDAMQSSYSLYNNTNQRTTRGGEGEERERLLQHQQRNGDGASSFPAVSRNHHRESNSQQQRWRRKAVVAAAAAVAVVGCCGMIATTTSSSPFKAGVGEAGAGGHRRPQVGGDVSPFSLAKLGAEEEAFSSLSLPKAAPALLGRKENDDDAHFYDGLHVLREDERELLRAYAAKIPSKREIKRLELEEKRETTANVGGSAPSMTASAGLGTMPRRTWKKKTSKETKEEQSRATKEFFSGTRGG